MTFLQGLLFAAAAISLFAGHLVDLWPVLFILLVFLLPLMISGQSLFKRCKAAGHLPLLVSLGAAAVAAFRFDGIGPVLLIDLILLQINLHFHPGVATVINASLTAGLVLLSVLVRDHPEAVWFHLVYFAVVSCLCWQIDCENKTGRSHEKTASRLRLNDKNLLINNRRIINAQQQAIDETRRQERNRMGRGIHDTLGHTLTAIIVQLSAALQLLPAEPGEIHEKINNARTEAKNGLANVRKTIEDLDAQGQTFAERILAAIQAAQAGLSVKILSLVDPRLILTAQQEALVLSGLQEGLTNGVRHGGATSFVFRLEQSGDNCLFYLEDNGRGTVNPKWGYGLTAMQASAGQLGGTFAAINHPDQGFLLRMTWPVKVDTVQNNSQKINRNDQPPVQHSGGDY